MHVNPIWSFLSNFPHQHSILCSWRKLFPIQVQFWIALTVCNVPEFHATPSFIDIYYRTNKNVLWKTWFFKVEKEISCCKISKVLGLFSTVLCWDIISTFTELVIRNLLFWPPTKIVTKLPVSTTKKIKSWKTTPVGYNSKRIAYGENKSPNWVRKPIKRS